METLQGNKKQFDLSCRVMPGGVSSPARAFVNLNMTPLIASSGKGSLLYDIEGTGYIDYCMSFGALILGHGHDKVVEESVKRLKKGSSFGLTTPLEEEFASFIVDQMPAIEQLRFVSSGTEATMTALRLARGYTQRPLIVKFNGNYHGHCDALLVKAGSSVSHINAEASSKGIIKDTLQNTLCLPYNDCETFIKLCRDPFYAKLIAAVIVEPIAANMGVVLPNRDFLCTLREETQRIGALCIFDEVITGFRIGLQGAQGLYSIKPDLTCLGKVIGGGYPLAVVGGRKEVMEQLAPIGEVYQAGTLSANPVALQAGLTTLHEISTPHFFSRLEEKTKCLTEPVRVALQQAQLKACIQEAGSMFSLFWGVDQVERFEDLKQMDQELFRKCFHFLIKRGIYFPPSPFETCFVSLSHTEEDMIKTRRALLDFIDNLR